MKQTDKAGMEGAKKKLMKRVEEINGMTYEKSKKEAVEKIRKELQKVDIICGAFNRQGKICSKKPVEGKNRCEEHGGLATGAVTPEGKARALANLNPRAHLIHGLYSKFVFTAEEELLYTALMNHSIDTYDLDPINVLLIDRAIRNLILNQRKEDAQQGEAINGIQFDIDYDTKFLRYIQALGLDRKFNMSTTNKDNAQKVDLTALFDMGGKE